MQDESNFVYPVYFRIVKREANKWYFMVGSVFYAPRPHSVDMRNLETDYGLTKGKVAIELFRINAGRAGFYLANLRDKKYYYCGLSWDDIKTTLLSLGIGRHDPMDLEE